MPRYQSKHQRRRAKRNQMLRQPQRPKSSGEGLVYRRISECFSLSESSSRTVTCVVLFGLVAYKFPCLLLAFTKVSVLNFELEPVYIVNHCWTERDVRLPLLLISHAKELIVIKLTLWFQKKNCLLFMTWKDIFGTEKASLFLLLTLNLATY